MIRVFYFTVIVLGLLFVTSGVYAQNIIRKGNTFEEVVDSTKSSDVKTDLVYKDRKGNEYQIYLSRNGNAYIICTSKKGNVYKRYLPKVTEQLGTKKENK